MTEIAVPPKLSWEDAVEWLRAKPDWDWVARDGYFDDPLLGAAQRYAASEEWQTVLQWIGDRRGAALDVGAGRGIATYALAKAGFTVVALEPDPSSLVGAGAIRALMDEAGLSFTLETRVGDPLPFADASFDIIFARAVLHHVPDMRAAVAEFARILKPGGRFIAVREHVVDGPEELQAFFKVHALHHLYGGENAFPAHVYADAIRAAGMRLDRTYNPLETPVNYGPKSRRDLADDIAARLPVPLRGAAAAAIRNGTIGPPLLSMLGRIDRRPGRHYSFVATKV
jgi:SAM-dependent methyltransferase